ncbi:MAG TPA: DegT/DnrJ/EryC1/StrS family aminotransferase, partial [Candidatus Limnocylindrales bacterium]|nr:DegT/DnrJ/EryC1/StrS family aminotransferase [Candidatus Limnocylindrales bacterium]
DDDDLADRLRLHRNQGMRARYQFETLGYNYRMTDINAAIGLVQLEKLDRNTAKRQAIAAAYDAGFAGLPVRVPVVPDGRTHVYHQYTLEVGPQRDAILAAVKDGGVGADIYYPIPVHRQAYIQERGLHADLPVTDRAAEQTIALPIYPGMAPEDRDTVIRVVRAAVLAHAEVGARA